SGQGEQGNITHLDRLTVGGMFISSCLFGISLTLWPNWRRRFVPSQKRNIARSKAAGRSRLGHHPDCTRFRDHVVMIGGGWRCAGCTGLAIGAITCIIFMVLYVWFPLSLTTAMLHCLFWSGLSLVTLNFAETYKSRSRSAHILSNTFLVVGFMLVVVSVFQATADIIPGVIALTICFLWLDTRIQLSRWRHRITCKKCPKACKSY
ncbi:MAG: hypothetical protein KAX31_00930, partial [Thermoplasmata archaeon]|nr:hypothetical protein [Thermoplasmata archaeon]